MTLPDLTNSKFCLWTLSVLLVVDLSLAGAANETCRGRQSSFSGSEMNEVGSIDSMEEPENGSI